MRISRSLRRSILEPTLRKAPCFEILNHLGPRPNSCLMSAMDFCGSVQNRSRVDFFLPFLEKGLPLSQCHSPYTSLRRCVCLSGGTCVPKDLVKYSGSCLEIMVFSVILELICALKKGAEMRQEAVNVVNVTSCAPEFKGKPSSFTS